MSTVYLESVGVLAHGLPDWPTARLVLTGVAPFDPTLAPHPDLRLLPENERRRAPNLVRWALGAAQEAMRSSERDASDVGMVFTSSSGDGEIVHKLCEAVAAPPRQVSPTQFHNSVHNAAPGYWSIGTSSRKSAVALCGHDASFAVGLLEATAMVVSEDTRVLLVACDLPYTGPLRVLRDIGSSFSVALLLSPVPGANTLAQWRVTVASGPEITRLPRSLPEVLAANPAAHALPLLAATAHASTTTLPLTYVGRQHIVVEVQSSP